MVWKGKERRAVEGGSSEMMKHLSSLIENREGGNDEDTEKEGNWEREGEKVTGGGVQLYSSSL